MLSFQQGFTRGAVAAIVAAIVLSAVGATAVLGQPATDGVDHGGGRGGRGPTCQNGTDSISGTVADVNGNAVVSATVRASGRAGRASTQTGADGSYTLANLCHGSYDVSADKRGVGSGKYDTDGDGHSTPVVLSDAAPAAGGIDIVLGAKHAANLCPNGTHTISGAVADSAGAAVEGATVHAAGWAGDTETQTAADGSYTIGGLCDGVYVVSAKKDGVGRGVYDADGDGYPTPILLTGAGASASGVDVTLAAASRRGP